MAEMKNEVWEAVNDYYELRMDKDLAVKRADLVVQLMEQGKKYRRYDTVRLVLKGLAVPFVVIATLLLDVAEWVVDEAGNILAIFATVAALGGIAFGIYTAAQPGPHDWAGFGPSKVEGHAEWALVHHYDIDFEDVPVRYFWKSQKKVHFAGHQAWYVKYLGKKGKTTCLWVWNAGPNRDPGEKYVLRTGADCD